MVDLQVLSSSHLDRELEAFRPEAVGFGLDYLANVPEVIDLAHPIKRRLPGCFTFAGGHGVSFIARHVVQEADGALDAVVRGDGEVVTPLLLTAARDGGARDLPGIVTPEGQGKGAPLMLESIDEFPPARDLMRRRRKYFIGELIPARRSSSLVGVRGTARSARRGRSMAVPTAKRQRQRRSFSRSRSQTYSSSMMWRSSKSDHGEAIAREVERRRIHKRYYLETRADVLLRNTDVFPRWQRLGLTYMFLGIEALDETGLELHRKRVSPDANMKALDTARRLGIMVAINLIVDRSG